MMMLKTDIEDMEDIEIVAGNIRRARIMRKISRKSLASKIGISEKRLRLLESGKNYQDDDLIAEISFSLNLPLGFFFQFPDKDFEEKVFLRNSQMSLRDQKSVVEWARYHATDAASLAVVMGLTPYSGIPKLDQIQSDDAQKLGHKMASEWLEREKTLTEALESRGVVVISLSGVSSLFRGVFIQKRGLPILAINDFPRSRELFIKDIAHGLGHAAFLQQGLARHEEENFCDFFSEGFLKQAIECGVEIGKFDFIPRTAIKAWRDEEISGSRAAEILNMRLFDFMEKYQYESQD